MRKRSEIGKLPFAPAPALPATPHDIFRSPIHVTCKQCGLEQPIGTSDCLGCGATLGTMKLVEGDKEVLRIQLPRPSLQEGERENLGKLAFDLKSKDLDINLVDIAALPSADRLALKEWVAAKSNDITPRVRMIIERLKEKLSVRNEEYAKANAASDQVFSDYTPTLEEARGRTIDDKEAMHITNVAVTNGVFPKGTSTTDEGEEVTYVLGKEMYRVTDFCTFDIGPYSATTRIRAGETRMDALRRVSAECEAMASLDRIARRDRYIATYLGIKPALKAASDSIKE